MLSFSRADLIKHINFIIDNSYIVFNGQIYRQIIGIPMGFSCAPHTANIFLHVYEYEFISKLVSDDDTERANKLSNLFRYQDDCVVFGDKNTDGTHVFEECMTEIYPNEMKLTCTNTSTSVCTYLDLYISVYQGKYSFKSYDKRNAFRFDVINYPNLTGNIPKKPSYGVFISQLVRMCRINYFVKHFKNDAKVLISKFSLQGFKKSLLIDKFKQFTRTYIAEWAKFGVDFSSNKFIHSIFN